MHLNARNDGTVAVVAGAGMQTVRIDGRLGETAATLEKAGPTIV